MRFRFIVFRHFLQRAVSRPLAALLVIQAMSWLWALDLARAGEVGKAAPGPVDFDQVFRAQGEPQQVHFVASYLSQSGPHRLEVWREGARRIRRMTDDTSDSYVTHVGHQEDWTMLILEHRRRVRLDLDRQTLIKLGTFTDWFDLAHGINRPFGPHRVSPVQPPSKLTTKAIEACEWFELSQSGRAAQVCWSARLRLALLIVNEGASTPVWRIESVDTRPIDKAVFTVHGDGYLRTDAAKDIMED